jgi:hypothetical protein
LFKNLLRMPFVRRARSRDRKILRGQAHALAIVCIFRNEAPFLDEWIRFHLSFGVDHFYLYNNFSADDFTHQLQPYIQSKIVTLYDWPVQTGQLSAYRHCIRNHAEHTRWMAFIDVDEFLFAPDGRSIADVLRNYSEHPAVVVHSPYFGSSGLVSRPSVPITRAFTRRAVLSMASAKTIANPRWIYAIRNVHTFKYWGGAAVATDGKEFCADCVQLDTLRLNHYWSRSLQDLEDKIARGDASTPQKRDRSWHFTFERELNAEEDLSILPHLARAFPDARFPS